MIMDCIIKKVIVKIDIDEYAEGLKKHKGFVDGSDTALSPNVIRTVERYDNFVDAELNIDDTVYIDIEGDEVVIEYEYIDGSEAVYFTKVKFNGKTYPIDENFYSYKCYLALVNYLDI